MSQLPGWTRKQGNVAEGERVAPLRPTVRAEEESFIETPDYAQFKASVLRKSGIDLNLYKQAQMHRRLYNMVERANLKTFTDYFDLINREPDEYAAFLDRMTINVSELFRNPEKWREMREQALPPMLARHQTLKIWSAGCSYGAEPYTLAILLDQMTPGTRHTLHATDLDRKILARAMEGKFAVADVKNLDAALLQNYFLPLSAPGGNEPGNDALPRWQVKPEMRARVTFRAHNLLADRFERDYDLICCRNVVIYFTDEAKEALYARFVQALKPGGLLFVGGTERIFQFRELGLECPIPFFYRKKA